MNEPGVSQNLGELYYDNQCVIHLAKNRVLHVRNKHIGMKYHKLKKIINNGLVRIIQLICLLSL